jgi:mono/diheme cytochrome c family protein
MLCLAVAEGASGQARPLGITDSTIARGRRLYDGKGACAKCHGDRGQGTPEGVSLTSGPWKLGSGSYEWICHIVRHSGIGARGRDGDPMPMRGPTLLSPDEVNTVAGYVWSISRAKAAQATK